MSMPRTLLATVLLSTIGMATVLHAQSPTLTNADVTRLVAMRVSDQTVIAVIHEATTTHFDLSTLAVTDLMVSRVSPAVLAAMRQPSGPTANGFTAPEQSPAAGPQTLVGAAAKAATQASSDPAAWHPRLSIVGPSGPPVSPTPASTAEVTKPEGTAINTTTTVKDEGWWKTRMGGLRDQLAIDKAACDPIAAQIRALQSTYDSYVFYDRNGTAKINTAAAAVVETKMVDAKTEQGKCVATVALDQKAIGTAEEEARRLGVFPGWLR